MSKAPRRRAAALTDFRPYLTVYSLTAPAESEAAEASETAAPASAPERLPEAISALAPLLSGEGVKHSKRDNDRACLLRALKPYLSPGRSEAIDYIIKFSSIADLLKNLS